jgi:hypothetical protein
MSAEGRRVLVACEFSGIVREAFRKVGCNAYSCDFLPSEISSEYHIQDDVLKHLDDGWDMMIAFPPCTYLANSGVRWMYLPDGSINFKRLSETVDAAAFFNKLLYADIPHIVIENPIQHSSARTLIREYDQIIQPWQFGHGETKQTCLWLKGLPLLKSSNIVSGRNHRIWYESPGPDRQKNRSRTFQGIADAMAKQWNICDRTLETIARQL